MITTKKSNNERKAVVIDTEHLLFHSLELSSPDYSTQLLSDKLEEQLPILTAKIDFTFLKRLVAHYRKKNISIFLSHNSKSRKECLEKKLALLLGLKSENLIVLNIVKNDLYEQCSELGILPHDVLFLTSQINHNSAPFSVKDNVIVLNENNFNFNEED